MGRLQAAAIWLACALIVSPPAPCADPQPYRVQFAALGDGAIDAALKSTSQLEALRKSAPVDPYGLIARARADGPRLETVLESFGYYQGSIAILIDSLALEAPDLAEHLAALPKDTDARVAISATLGPLYHVGHIELQGELPAGLGKLGLAPGDPAVASQVLAAGARLQAELQDEGYAFARVEAPVAYEKPAERVLDLQFRVATGPKVGIGEIQFRGLKSVHESYVRKRLLLHTGDGYRAANVEKARRDLLALGLFTSISVELGRAPDALGRVPVTFTVRERLRRALALSAAYSSDLGMSGGVRWTNRNLLGNGEQLRLAAAVTNIGGTATRGLGYDTSAAYVIPEIGHRDQSVQLSLGGIKQSLQAYDQTAATAGVTLSRKLSGVWSANLGLTAAREQIVQAGVTRDYTLLALPTNLLYDSTDLHSPLEDPIHGMRATLSLAPTLSLGNPQATFLVTQATLSGYLDFERLLHQAPGRSVLALRIMNASAAGASEFSLPPDQRFYAGGSGTVRGYRYQSVGPQATVPCTPPANGRRSPAACMMTIPLGGISMQALNIELRQRFGTNFGAVLFADAGGASESLRPATGVFRVGVGAGVRYYTPIGPLRVDLAVPTNRRPNDDRFEIYIGIGQAF